MLILLGGQEGSIFEVLVRRRLQAVKFSIIKTIEQPIEIVETYTIAFDYQNEHFSGTKRVEFSGKTELNTGKDDMNAPVRNFRSTVDVIKGIKQMDRLLAPFTTTLTKLPSTRALGVFLFYTDDCPDEYQAPDFVEAGDFLFKFTCDEEQAVRKLSCGGISTGYHSYVLHSILSIPFNADSDS